MFTELEFVHCPICEQESPVEMPPCQDGHGDDCPERLCTACGYMLTVAPALPRSRSRKRVA